LVVLAAVFMMFSFSMAGLADVQSPSIGSQTGKTANPLICGPGESYAGAITWVHPSTGNIMVNGRDGHKIFDVSKATMEGLPEANHFVTVNYTVVNGDRIASSVTVVPWKMAHRYVGDF
jgi:hypothetical protein